MGRVVEMMLSLRTRILDLERGERATEVGARLRALRLQRNLTLASLAERAGVSRRTLSTLKRTGRASLETVATVMCAVGREGELDRLLVRWCRACLPDSDSVRAARFVAFRTSESTLADGDVRGPSQQQA